jgi:hypothetical protein
MPKRKYLKGIKEQEKKRIIDITILYIWGINK